MNLRHMLGQEHRRGRCTARVAFFAGKGEPIPQRLELRDPIFEWELPYLCTPDGLVPLVPGLVYAPRSTDGRFGLFLLDAIDAGGLRFKSVVDSSQLTQPEGITDIGAWVKLPFSPEEDKVTDGRPQLEPIQCADGRTLHEYLSGTSTEPQESTSEDGPQPGTAERKPKDVDTEGITTLHEFERRADIAGLGAVYRDVVYFLAERSARAGAERPFGPHRHQGSAGAHRRDHRAQVWTCAVSLALARSDRAVQHRDRSARLRTGRISRCAARPARGLMDGEHAREA